MDDGGTADPTKVAENITVDCKNQVEYTGYPVSPLQSIIYQTELDSLGRQTLAERKDYTLTYYKVTDSGMRDEEQLSTAPIDVGEYVVRITGIGNYTNELEYRFTVVAAGKTLKAEIKGENTVTYKAADYHPTVDVKTESGSTLNANNYTLSYVYTDPSGKASTPEVFQSGITDFRNAGTYTITANGIGNYAGAFGQTTFTIKPKNLADEDEEDGTATVAVADIADQHYNGQAITFDGGLSGVTYSGLKEGGLETPVNLKYGTDYNLTYMNNTNAGEADAVLIGAGNYTGSRDMKFKIQPKQIYVEVLGPDGKSAPEKIYGEVDPEYTYKVYEDVAGQTPLTDVPLTGKPGRELVEDAGEYDLTVDGNGSTLSAGTNYAITLKDSPKLTITPKVIGTAEDGVANLISANRVTYLSSDETFGNAKDRISVTYWAAKLGQQDVDCIVTITDAEGKPVNDTDTPTEKAEYTITVTPTDSKNYDGKLVMTATAINADYLLKFAPAQAEFTYTNDPDYPNRFTFTLSDKSGTAVTPDNFISTVATRNGKQVTLADPVKNDDGSYTCTLSDAGTYIIEAIKMDGDKVYQGSVVVTVKPKDVKDIQIADGIENSTQDYTGNSVELGDNLLVYNGIEVAAKEDNLQNYTVSYSDNVQPDSQATATITGMGNYTGTRNIGFKIGPMQYTLEYNANGGNSAAPASQKSQTTFSVAAGNTMTHAKAQVDGKDVSVLFIGWSTLNDEGKIYAKGDNLPAADRMFYAGQTLTPTTARTTLYAIWGYDTDGNNVPDVTQDTITVRYDRGSDNVTGEPPVDSQTYLVGQTATAKGAASLAREKYVFMGWTPTAGDHAATTLEAYLNLVGGMYTEGATFVVGISGGSVFTLYPVWGVDNDNNGKADFLEDGNVQLIYHANGGNGEPDAQSVQPGKEVALSNIKPTRPGAYFLGWTVDRITALQTAVPDKDIEIYQPKDMFTVPEGTMGTKTIYALWAENKNNNDKPDYEEGKYSVTYNLNGGNGTPPTDENEYLADQTVTLKDGAGLTKAGYVFDGWSLTEDGQKIAGNTYTTPKSTDGGRINFYAVWKENKHTVTVTVLGLGGTAQVVCNGETANPATVSDGDDVIITFAPSTGYTLGSVLVDETPKTDQVKENELTLTDVTKDILVVVTFQSEDFTVETPDSKVYTGSSLEPDLKVTSGGKEVTGYTVSYAAVDGTGARLDDTNKQPLTAGTYTVTVEGKDAYAGKTATTTFVITPKELTSNMVKDIVDQSYTGNAITPDVEVKDGTTELNSNVDYTVSYRDNVQPGETATVTIMGIGNYTGTVKKNFTIKDGRLFHVTYDGNSGTGTAPTDETAYQNGTSVTVLDQGNLTKEGFVFAGWNTKADGTGTICLPNSTFMITSDTTLYAVWTKETKVKVTYHLPDNTTQDSDSVPIGRSVKLQDGPKAADGYTFLGWTTGEKAKEITSAENISDDTLGRLYKAGEYLVLTKDVDLAPVWINTELLSTYHLVLYRSNGGDDSGFTMPTAYLVADGAKHSIITGIPTRDGYTFAGWTIGTDETVYQHEGEHSSYEVTGDVTFTAEWTKNAVYKVTYDASKADGTAPTDNAAYQSGATVTVLGQGNLKKDGYVFSGWNTQADGKGETYQPGETFEINAYVTLYAVWKENKHRVIVTTIGLGGSAKISGSDSSQIDVTDGGSVTIEFTPNTGYTLDSVTVNGTPRTVDPEATEMLLESIESDIVVIVTFQSEDFTVAAPASQEYTGTALEPDLAVKSGETSLVKDTDYTVSYKPAGTSAQLDKDGKPLNAGTYTVTVTGKTDSAYVGKTAVTTFVITPKTLTDDMVKGINNQPYTGDAITPQVTIEDGDSTLVKDIDYTVSYSENVGPGQAVVTITGIGNYTGVVTKTFELQTEDLR